MTREQAEAIMMIAYMYPNCWVSFDGLDDDDPEQYPGLRWEGDKWKMDREPNTGILTLRTEESVIANLMQHELQRIPREK